MYSQIIDNQNKLLLEKEQENADLKTQIEKMKKDLQEIKMSYDNSKDKTPINAMGAEYRLLCNIENIIEEWEIEEK